MKKVFVRTKNVKNFVNLMNNLKNSTNEIPKMGLIYGDPGLGKTQTAIWWAMKNNAVYVRAQNRMTSKWLLESIIYELGEAAIRRKTSDLVEQCIAHLRMQPQMIIVDEVDYLVNKMATIETLRDIHDLACVPIVLIGMLNAKTKLGTYKHFYDRISEKLEFETFAQEDIDIIIDELSEVKIMDDAKVKIFEKINRFRQLTKIISLIETLAQTNGLTKIDAKHLKGFNFEQ